MPDFAQNKYGVNTGDVSTNRAKIPIGNKTSKAINNRTETYLIRHPKEI